MPLTIAMTTQPEIMGMGYFADEFEATPPGPPGLDTVGGCPLLLELRPEVIRPEGLAGRAARCGRCGRLLYSDDRVGR